MYNDIILNSNTYNPLTGRFTAPLDGTYIFHYHGLAQNNQVCFHLHYCLLKFDLCLSFSVNSTNYVTNFLMAAYMAGVVP